MSHFINYLSGDILMERYENNRYITFSDVSASHIHNVFPTFSVKYVFDGRLDYKTTAETFEVKKNNTLYAAAQPGEVRSHDPGHTRCVALCAGFQEELFLEALRVNKTGCFSAAPEAVYTDFSRFPQFLDGVFSKENNEISKLLHGICASAAAGTSLRECVTEEWFLMLAEKIVREQQQNYHSVSCIPVKKLTTQKEVFRRLHLAKEFMDDTFLSNPSNAEIAKISLLSEYHFYRCFKSAFGVSPHRYVLNKRLAYTKNMLEKGECNLSVIAGAAGFPDQFTFSKAFKQAFKISPKMYRQNLQVGA